MTKHELAKAYDFKATEPRVYEMWESGGYFRPWNDPNRPGFDPSVKPFVISIPPPNVTGELHLGHATRVSMEDLMIRYHRMKGIPTLWVPGTDHAGIATQLMVERDLLRRRGGDARGTGPRGIRQAHVGVEEEVRQHHHEADPAPGRILRLGARALHAGRGAVARGARGLRAPVRQRV